MSPQEHVQESLVSFVNGTLAPDRADAVRLHLGACAQCRAELRAWEAVAAAARTPARLDAPGATGVADRAWARIAHMRAQGRRPGRHPAYRAMALVWQVVMAQVRLLPQAILWPACAATGLGFVLAMLAARTGHTLGVFGVIVSIGGGLGGALCTGPEVEPCAELAASLPLGPRLVLATRLAAVFAVNALVGLVASAALAAVHGAPHGLWGVTDLWLGPMLALGAFSAALAALWGTVTAATGAVMVWAVRLFGGAAVAAVWHTSALTLLIAATLAVLSLAIRPRVPRTA